MISCTSGAPRFVVPRRVLSMGCLHNQHMSSRAMTRAMTVRLRCPLDDLGLPILWASAVWGSGRGVGVGRRVLKWGQGLRVGNGSRNLTRRGWVIRGVGGV